MNTTKVLAVPSVNEFTGYTEWAAVPSVPNVPAVSAVPSVPSLARMVAVERLFFSTYSIWVDFAATIQKENSSKHTNFNDNELISKDTISTGTGELK